MTKYESIDNVYERDRKTNKVQIGKFRRKEFEYLRHCDWDWTEKVDGMNVRVMWNQVIWVPHEGGALVTETSQLVTFAGRTDKAKLPEDLEEYLQKLFWHTDFTDWFEDKYGDIPVCLYGEGYGAGINQGGRYGPDKKFILFDIKIGESFVNDDHLRGVAMDLGLDVVPEVGVGSLRDAITLVSNGLGSQLTVDPTGFAEGIVARPSMNLINRHGQRIITKIKTKDFFVREEFGLCPKNKPEK